MLDNCTRLPESARELTANNKKRNMSSRHTLDSELLFHLFVILVSPSQIPVLAGKSHIFQVGGILGVEVLRHPA